MCAHACSSITCTCRSSLITCRSSYVMLATACTYVHTCTCSCLIAEARELPNSLFFTLFQVAFGLPIAFWTSLEASVIEMKSATLALQNTAVSLNLPAITSEQSIFAEIAFLIFFVLPSQSRWILW